MVDPLDDPIELVSSQERWQTQYEAERDRILGVFGSRGLGDSIERIEHVGSTAVQGLAAKDIVDIDIVVADDAVADISRTLETELGGTRHENTIG